MIEMAVSNQNALRKRHFQEIKGKRAEILHPEQVKKYRVHQDVLVTILNHDAGVFYKGNGTAPVVPDSLTTERDFINFVSNAIIVMYRLDGNCQGRFFGCVQSHQQPTTNN